MNAPQSNKSDLAVEPSLNPVPPVENTSTATELPTARSATLANADAAEAVPTASEADKEDDKPFCWVSF